MDCLEVPDMGLTACGVLQVAKALSQVHVQFCY